MIIFLVMSVMLNIALAIALHNQPKTPPCSHKWKVVMTTKIYDISFGSRTWDHTLIRMQCEKCGCINTKREG